MKIRGKKTEFAPASELIVFPRGDGEVAFRVTAVLDRDEFDKVCPDPKPPKKRVKGGQLVDDFESSKFQDALRGHNKVFMEWLVIKSLSVPGEKEGDPDTPIEWEKVVVGLPRTWGLWDEEFREAGFSDMERKRIFNACASVNSLNEARLDEARASFLQRRREEPDQSSSPTAEPSDTPYTELVNDSESVHQESPEAGMTLTSDSTGGQ